ncbi:MAG: low molecular weight phosphatase family protein [Candidatus Nanohaloarchaea archaeon]
MRVLYICTGNSFRSPAAEALTRRFKPSFEVESAGTNPASDIAGNVKSLLDQEQALKYVKPSPDKISQRALDEADKIVCMSEKHLQYIKENFDFDGVTEVWGISDPVEEGVNPEEVFEKIEKRVKNLED